MYLNFNYILCVLVVDDVTKKLKAMRDTRRRYLAKVKATRSGSGTDDVYKSKIWWVYKLAFLDATFSQRSTIDNTVCILLVECITLYHV
jgi:response regulator RpfG family c-di-GMP phosphodiesterase